MLREKGLTGWVWGAESEARGPSRGHAEQGRWFRLHAQGKPAATFDTGIVNVAVAVLDSDVRRAMYGQPLLSQEKFKGMLASPLAPCYPPPSPHMPPHLPTHCDSVHAPGSRAIR